MLARYHRASGKAARMSTGAVIVRRRRGGLGDSTPYPQTVALAKAIAKAEGGLTPGTAPYRTNNPCDVFVGGSTAGYSTMQAGWDACYSQINLMNSGGSSYYTPDETLSDVAKTYAPSSGGNIPSNWAANVAAALGVSPSTTLAQIAAGSPSGSTMLVDPATGTPISSDGTPIVDDSSSYNLDSSFDFSLTDSTGNVTPFAWGLGAVAALALLFVAFR
jgi:hypothetical protein